MLATPASAHAELIGSTPAAGATIDIAPLSISLVFSDDINPQFAAIAVAVGGSEPVEVLLQVKGAEVVVDLPVEVVATSSAEPTSWTTSYRVVSQDGHPITGTIDFTVAPAPSGAVAPDPSHSPDPTSATPSATPPESRPAGGRPATTGDSGLSGGQLLGAAGLVLAGGFGVLLLVTRRRSSGSS